MKFLYIRLIQIAAVAAVIIVTAVLWNRMCTTVTPTDAVMGSHGWGVWFDETIQVFEHNDERICVPEEWASIGAIDRGPTWVKFPPGQSAILVRPETFATYDLTFAESAYSVRVVYPIEMTPEVVAPYIANIIHSFERVGALYPNATEPVEHTILISVGLAGDAVDFESTLYPEPGPSMSVLGRAYIHERSEELFTHAVAHLYNRYRPDLMAYENTQSPIPLEDFQEMEASWIEIFARSTNEGRVQRVSDMYAVHEAVHTNAYSPNLLYPFSEREYFDDVTQLNVVLPIDGTYSDFQYGHYILAPLSLVAADGLLIQRKSPVYIADILTTIHGSSETNLFTELARYLTPDDMEQIRRWMNGEELIPVDLVDKGLALYEK